MIWFISPLKAGKDQGLYVTGTQCEAKPINVLVETDLPRVCSLLIILEKPTRIVMLIFGTYFTTSGAYAKIFPVYA